MILHCGMLYTWKAVGSENLRKEPPPPPTSQNSLRPPPPFHPLSIRMGMFKTLRHEFRFCPPPPSHPPSTHIPSPRTGTFKTQALPRTLAVPPPLPATHALGLGKYTRGAHSSFFPLSTTLPLGKFKVPPSIPTPCLWIVKLNAPHPTPHPHPNPLSRFQITTLIKK